MATADRAERAAEEPRIFFRALARALWATFKPESVMQAQAVAFNMFLAFFPAILFLTGLVAYVAPGLEDYLQGVRLVLPPSSRRAVVDSFLKLTEVRGQLLFGGAVGTVMLGSQLMFTLSRVFSGIYGREERRSFWRRQVRAFAMVALVTIPWVAVSALLVFGRVVRTWLIERLGVGFDAPVRLLWTAGYFAVAVLTATLVLAALYHYLTPDPRSRWNDVLPGAGVAMGLWWIATSGFGFYVRKIAPYDILYGGFAAAIGLLVWMFISSMVILIGARYNHESTARRAR
jgi:membrane protein